MFYSLQRINSHTSTRVGDRQLAYAQRGRGDMGTQLPFKYPSTSPSCINILFTLHHKGKSFLWSLKALWPLTWAFNMIFLYGMESTLFFHLCFIDFPSLPPTFSLCQLLTLPLLLLHTLWRQVEFLLWATGSPGTDNAPSSGGDLVSVWFSKRR